MSTNAKWYFWGFLKGLAFWLILGFIIIFLSIFLFRKPIDIRINLIVTLIVTFYYSSLIKKHKQPFGWLILLLITQGLLTPFFFAAIELDKHV